MKRKNLWILVGIPGSGKSTWAKREANKETDIIISRDEIRFSLLNENDEYFSKEKLVWKTFIKEIQKAIDENKENIFIDATHLNRINRDKVQNALNIPDHYNVYAACFITPLDVCLERNAGRTGRAFVPEEVIRDMKIHQYTIPCANEEFTDVFLIDENLNNLGPVQKR